MIRRWVMVGLLAACGCGNGLDVPDGASPPANVTVSGAVSGTFHAIVHSTYNLASAKDETVISVLTAANPGLGIDSFAIDALVAGIPQVKHYGERDAQMLGAVTLNDGRTFQSTVNSQNRLDITAVTAPMGNPDGSRAYTLSGTAAGAASEHNSSDTIFFQVDF